MTWVLILVLSTIILYGITATPSRMSVLTEQASTYRQFVKSYESSIQELEGVLEESSKAYESLQSRIEDDKKIVQMTNEFLQISSAANTSDQQITAIFGLIVQLMEDLQTETQERLTLREASVMCILREDCRSSDAEQLAFVGESTQAQLDSARDELERNKWLLQNTETELANLSLFSRIPGNARTAASVALLIVVIFALFYLQRYCYPNGMFVWGDHIKEYESLKTRRAIMWGTFLIGLFLNLIVAYFASAFFK